MPDILPMSADEILENLQKSAAKRNGSVEEVCSRIKLWGEQRRVTPQQKQLTPEAVAVAVARFQVWAGETLGWSAPVSGSPHAASAPAPPSLVASGETAMAGPTAPAKSESPAPVTAAQPASQPAIAQPTPEPAAQPTPEPADKTTPEPAASREKKRKHQDDQPKKKETAKERRLREKEEAKAREAEEERLAAEKAAPFQGLSVEEMREKRMAEVMREMDGRMRDIACRTAESLGQEPPDDAVLAAAGDRRDAYMRLIHRVREEVSLPEGLQAELMPHQVEGLEWLISIYANNLHGILADEMGLGKTLQSIALVQWLKEFKENKGPHLVVAPKSTLANWKSEFEKFAPRYKVWLLVGEQEERERLAKKLKKRTKHDKTALYITNYEQIHRNEWLQEFDWQVIIIDEGHRMKNQSSVLHQTMVKMRCRTRLLLTGTPLQNNLNELWALLHYLLPELFASSLDFQQWFLEPLRGVKDLNEYEVELRPEDEAVLISRLHTMLSPFLLQRTKAQALPEKLPPKTEHIVRVELSAWQRAAYEDLQKRTIRLLTAGDKVETIKVNNALMQLRKIVLHPYLFSDGYEVGPNLFRAAGKVEVLDRILPKLLKFGHKTLIFSQFTSVLDVLGQYLQWKGLSFARLDGQTRHEERRAQMDAFSEDSSMPVFLLSARAGGLGLNLQTADTVILFDLDWNPQNDKQAIARAHRFGQQNEVRVLRLLTVSGVEQHMERRCQEKLELEQKIIGAGMFSNGASQEQRVDMLRNILGLGEGGPGQTSASEAKQPTPPDALNEMLARSEEELVAFREMDQQLLSAADAAQDHGQYPAELSQLVRLGRLMRPDEVPSGFHVEEDEDGT
eukprot:TRINITY_DN27069_c0_g2_i1.p1 TRINITY_DN27069_c0_g2~~TRINITY_DN27069_c0_g2_i1.p1  ORF type:complete len:850 (-),score=172.99 TRINITY_DN27069_c0_g2_i1:24-2573(-)